MSLLLSGPGSDMHQNLSFHNNFFLFNNWRFLIKDSRMSRCSLVRPVIRATIMMVVSAASPSSAAPSTSQGLVSVAQVIGMLDEESTDRKAQQILTAYLAGTGKAASVVLQTSGASVRIR